MFSQLVEANMEKKSEPVIAVINLLKELRGAWVQIREKKKPEEKKGYASGQSMMQNNKINTEKRKKIKDMITPIITKTKASAAPYPYCKLPQ